MSFAIFNSCGTSSPKTDGAPVITVSIYPQKFFIDRISGNYYRVNVMIPKTMGHSDYSPTARQMKELANSKAYLAIGPLDFELTWADRLKSVSPNLNWIDLSTGYSLISGHVCTADHHHHHSHSYDPHYWMSPSGASHLAQRVKKELDVFHPERAEMTSQNLERLLAEIELLHRSLEKLGSQKLTFLIYHPALAYLARDYQMTQLVIEQEGKTPTPSGLRNIIDQAKSHQVRHVFVQKNFDENNARVAAKAIGAKVISFNPENEDWISEMNALVQHLSEQP